MMLSRYSVTLLLGLLFLLNCKGPSSPDFNVDHALQIPLINNNKITFIGESNSLLDTTSIDLESLFRVDEKDNLVSLVFESDFNIGDFDDVLPGMSVEPSSFTSQIGMLEASFSGDGLVTFEEVTGSPDQAGGFPLPTGNSSDLFVEMRSANFESGVVEEGGIRLEFINSLGFDLATLEAELYSDGNAIGSTITLTDVDRGETVSDVITFQGGEHIETGNGNLQVKINLGWDAQTTTGTGAELSVTGKEEELLASRATAILGSQTFSSEDNLDIDDEEFRFTDAGHYVRLNSGSLLIHNLVNNIDLDIDTLDITVPGILTPAGTPLVISFSGNSRILRKNAMQGAVTREVPLKDHQLFALNNRLVYEISGVTENTELSSSQFRTIQEDDAVNAEMSVTGLQFFEVYGDIQPKMVEMNETDNEIIDIYNDEQAEVSEFNDLDFFSDRVKNLNFHDSRMDLIYTSNIGVDGTVYAAILGINNDGEEMYLSGKSGSGFEVTPGDNIQGLQAGGQDIPLSRLIQFDTRASDDLMNPTESKGVLFDNNNSNIEEFISNMPTEIRFIGKTLNNPEGETGFVIDPVIFDVALGMNMPLNISTDGVAQYSDTMMVDLSDLPGPQDDSRVSEAILSVHYENRLPFFVDLTLSFLNDADEEIVYYPASDNQPLRINSAGIDEQSRFAREARADVFEFSLKEDQLDKLYQTRKLKFTIGFETESSDQVKVRAEDYININAFGKFKTTTKVKSE